MAEKWNKKSEAMLGKSKKKNGGKIKGKNGWKSD